MWMIETHFYVFWKFQLFKFLFLLAKVRHFLFFFTLHSFLNLALSFLNNFDFLRFLIFNLPSIASIIIFISASLWCDDTITTNHIFESVSLDFFLNAKAVLTKFRNQQWLGFKCLLGCGTWVLVGDSECFVYFWLLLNRRGAWYGFVLEV